MALEGKRALILIADNFQDEEGVEPAVYFRERGVEVVYAGLRRGSAEGKNGRHEVEVTHTVDEIDPASFDLLIIPGGAAPETLRLNERVLEITRAFMELPGKIVGAICHGPQVLISARVLPGRTVTCFAGIRDDVVLAGARYVDRRVMVEGRLVTSRIPSDVPAFCEALERALGGGVVAAGEATDTAPEEPATPDEPAPAEGPVSEEEPAAPETA